MTFTETLGRRFMGRRRLDTRQATRRALGTARRAMPEADATMLWIGLGVMAVLLMPLLLATRRRRPRTVGDVMVSPPITIDATASLKEAAQRMREGNVGALPVVEGGRVRGIITARDLVVRAMALGAVAGLVPYLYTAWADARGLPMNYLRLVVEPESGMFGLTAQTFDSSWERIRWLILGAETRLFPYFRHPRLLAANISDALAYEFLFDAGLLTLILVPIGSSALWREQRRHCAALVGTGVFSFLFAVSFADGRMLLPFLLPCTLILALFSALGAGRLAAVARRPARSRALAVGIAALAVLLSHALRARAQAEPIGPRRWRHQVEGGPELAGFWPRLDGAWEPRRTGERALELIPDSALVIGRWRELMTLYYLRDVEGRRPDLTFDPVYRGHEPRYARWQDTHDVRARPFVLLGRSPEIEPYLARLESVTVTPRLTLYVQREPMRGLVKRIGPR